MDTAANILFGKTRQSVLVLLFEQPESSFYLREISRVTGIGPGPLQQELSQLLKADLVLRANDGNRVTYRANTQHPIFSDLQAIVSKTCGLPYRLKAALAPASAHIEFAAIYGSLAKGSNHGQSDIDLLVVGTLPLQELVALIRPLEEQTGREISIRLYTPDDFRTRRESGDAFLSAVISGALIPLAGTLHDA